MAAHGLICSRKRSALIDMYATYAYITKGHPMALTLYHHPYSRASNVVWMLEEVGVPYELRFVDILKKESKSADLVKLNGMGKIPILTDNDVVMTESAAIGLYLADRYGYGRLAPKVDDPLRAPYLRWSFFAPSVIEPAIMAKREGWQVKEMQAGWGSYDSMLQTIDAAIDGRQFLLGDTFTMADCVFGGLLRFMISFKTIEPSPALAAYAARLASRPASQRADEKNQQVRAAHGLK